MKESMWGYYLILLGIGVSTFMIMITNMTTTNQQDYYLLKEVTNAAMIDALDYGYYRTYGEMKINTEKFVENFIRRFTEGISKTNSYKLDFYSTYENPPSVSIKVTSNTGDYHIFGDSTNIDVVNSIDAILEANNTITESHLFYSIPYESCDKSNYISQDINSTDYGFCQMTNRAQLNIDAKSIIYEEIQKKVKKNIKKEKIKILNVEYLRPLTSSEDLDEHGKQFGSTYKREGNLADVPSKEDSGYVITEHEKYFAKNIKDVKVTVKEGNDGNYYLAYGLKFNCEGVDIFKFYRKGTDFDNMVYRATPTPESEQVAIAEGYEKAPFFNNCLVGIQYKVDFYYDE